MGKKLSLGSVLAGAGAFTGGYAQGRAEREREEREKVALSMAREQHDMRMQEAGQRQQQQAALRDALRPATVETANDVTGDDDGNAMPPVPSLRMVTGTGVQRFDTPEAANAAAGAYNTRDAQVERATGALMAHDPERALSLSSVAIQGKRAAAQLTREQEEYAKKVREEGMVEAAQAARGGNPQELFDAFNKSGKMKLKAVPTVKEEVREIPGYGPIRTYTFTGTLVGPDGTEQEGSINSHDFTTKMMPYEKVLDLQRRGVESESRVEARAAQIENAAKKLELQGMVAEARIMRAQAQAAGAGGAAAAPAEKPAKPMPAAAAKAHLDNLTNLRRAERALALAEGRNVDDAKGDVDATGKKGYLPNQVLNRADPKGVDTRAAIADLGSLVIHDRSGAAVTAAEFPRLAPFIPSEKDDADTVKKKLKAFVSNYRAVSDDTKKFYEASGYRVPELSGLSPATTPPAPQRGAVDSGYRFKGGNPADPKNWEPVK